MCRGSRELPDLPFIAKSDNSQLQSKTHYGTNMQPIENSILKVPPQINIEEASPIKVSVMRESSEGEPKSKGKPNNVNKINTDQNLL